MSRLTVFTKYVFMFEKRSAVVRLPVVTFRRIFAEVAKMLPAVSAFVNTAFPEVYKFERVPPMFEDTTMVEAFRLWVFIVVENIF